MASCMLPYSATRGARFAGALVAAAALALTAVANAQAPAKKTPDKAPAQKGAPAKADAGQAAQSAWVKLCEGATAVQKGKDGKDEKKNFNICLTHHERLDGNTGMVLVSAAVRHIDGQDKQHFMVMVPLGMLLQPGMRATIYPKDMWEKVQKNEKPDDSKLKTMRLGYTLCHPAGCTAEVEATPELIGDLKGGGGLLVFAINSAGAPIAFPVPLNGFEQSLAGGPVDGQKYSEARRALMQQIAQRQQQMADDKRKQDEKGPATPPAKAAPPAQKK